MVGGRILEIVYLESESRDASEKFNHDLQVEIVRSHHKKKLQFSSFRGGTKLFSNLAVIILI